jgi:hypothetical protein
MKKALIVLALLFLVLGLSITLLVIAVLHSTKKDADLNWGPEARQVRILSANEASFNAFYGTKGGTAIERSASYYYKAKAQDVASGINLRWKLRCDRQVKPPVTMTYTPYGEDSVPRMEIHLVVGGPFKDEQEATASVDGAIPADEMLVQGAGTIADDSTVANTYLLQRPSLVGGKDFRSADPGSDVNGRLNVRFTLTRDAGERFYDYTSKNVGKSLAVVMGGRVREVATIQNGIRDSGEISGSFTAEEVAALSELLRADADQNHRTENFGLLADAGETNHCNVTADREFDLFHLLFR